MKLNDLMLGQYYEFSINSRVQTADKYKVLATGQTQFKYFAVLEIVSNNHNRQWDLLFLEEERDKLEDFFELALPPYESL